MPPNQRRAPEKKNKAEDVVWVHSQTPGGEALNVVRKRGDTLSLGQVRKAEEGKPIAGELLALEPREGEPRLFDVEVLHAAPTESGSAERSAGPANVSTPAYRQGWASVFGKRKRDARLN